MAMDSMTKYRNMMKNMESSKGPLSDAERLMRPDNIEEMIKQDPNLSKLKIQPTSKEMIMKQLEKTVLPKMRPTGVGSTTDAELQMMKEMQSGAGSMSDDEIMAMRNREAMNMQGNMGGAMSDAESEMITKILGKSAPSDLKMAMEALMQLGLSEAQILDILSSTDGLASAIGTPEANPRTMTEGALGSLPQRTTPTEMRPESFGADRTQSMEMQKEAMGT